MTCDKQDQFLQLSWQDLISSEGILYAARLNRPGNKMSLLYVALAQKRRTRIMVVSRLYLFSMKAFLVLQVILILFKTSFLRRNQKARVTNASQTQLEKNTLASDIDVLDCKENNNKTTNT